ncbi:hypothetical protein GCM10023086_21410 [Streptomyces venetus]|uniref:Uncharacterized protein n=1 Tax=Streptomyces venetus TaxID=1701086 RepID=A0ABP8FI24_9ACTN
MTYVVTVDARIPEGTPEMDPLQRAGAVALIEDGFDSVEDIEEPGDGGEADLIDSIVAVHPGGAHLKVFVDAPALELAEEAVRLVVAELLEQSELLADWRIERCEVELHPELAQESLDAADGPDAPPDDPADRKARHSERPRAEDDTEDYDAEANAETARGRILTLAAELRSFPPAMFGASPENASLAAGAVVYATDVLVDELFQDVQTLATGATTAAECDSPLWRIDDLPERYALQYDARFARRFLVTVIAMTTRFTDGSFQRLSCVAEELALRLLLHETKVTLETYGLLDDGVSAALDSFAGNVYEDMDHEWLYDDSMDGIDDSDAGAALGVTPMAFKTWFTPFEEGRYVHPSAADL